METYLTIEKLAPYLPYNLKAASFSGNKLSKSLVLQHGFIHCGSGFLSVEHILNSERYKPILRPLSDLTKEIEVNGQRFMPSLTLRLSYTGEMIVLNPATWSYRVIEILFKCHFDVFGLIPAGLAIDINTL